MPSDLKMCNCRQCKRGRGPGKDYGVHKARKRYRKSVKEALRRVRLGEDADVSPQGSTPYTD